MPEFDLLIRGAQPFPEVGIVDGRIAALGSGSARVEMDATGLHVFPGVIDSHVHFNEPGRAEWEGIATGSQALAAGGGTLFFDMPLNAHPPTCDAASFDEKLAAAKNQSATDFAFWGGLVPGNLDQLDRLAERGVVGFKAFMSNSGIEDFSCVDIVTLKEGMKRAARLGQLVAVHAESERITGELTRAALAGNRVSIRDYLDSRPLRAELEAIRCVIELAQETKCALHIVHVSSGVGVALVADAQAQGADVTCETCPHYLTLTDEDMEKLGAVAKCAPPLRSKPDQTGLWQCLESGQITTIGSDHSPSPPDMKRGENFFKVWGGISGGQHALPLLITEGHGKRNLALSTIANLTSLNVARRFRLPQTKGRIAVGADADFALVDLRQRFTVAKEDLFYRHQQSPYVGRMLTGRVVRTILRGQTIFEDGKIVSPPIGQLVKPAN